MNQYKPKLNKVKIYPAYGQHTALSYVCDLGVPILNHESESIPWVFSIPWVHVYTMIPCIYHESMSTPWGNVYTTSPCLYHKFMSIPWYHVYTINPCLYNESMSSPWVFVNSIPCIHVYTMSPCQLYESMSIPRVKKFNNKKYKYKLQKKKREGKKERKILHTGNTRPSCTCVIQE